MIALFSERPGASPSCMRWCNLIGVVAVAVVLVCAACALFGCGPDESQVAARYDGGEIAEKEVNDYTAQFRSQMGYEDDDDWAQYLYEEDLTAQTWRTRAIGALVEDALVQDAARDAGITVDEQRVEDQIASDKETAGIDAGDDAAWREYLESLGTTEEEYRENLEQASLESQLLSREVSLDAQSDLEEIEDYMHGFTLGSRIVCRYRALAYDSEASAQAVLDELLQLPEEELPARFDELVEQDDSDETTAANKGDIGWDIASDWGSMQQELNPEFLEPGQLSKSVHELDGVYYVLLCTNRFVFSAESTYDSIPDDELKAFVLESATYDNWNDMVESYIAGLRDGAHVQVHETSEKLPYDVDDKIAELKAQVSK